MGSHFDHKFLVIEYATKNVCFSPNENVKKYLNKKALARSWCNQDRTGASYLSKKPVVIKFKSFFHFKIPNRFTNNTTSAIFSFADPFFLFFLHIATTATHCIGYANIICVKAWKRKSKKPAPL